MCEGGGQGTYVHHLKLEKGPGVKVQQNKMREKIWEQNLEALGKKYEDHDYYSSIF